MALLMRPARETRRKDLAEMRKYAVIFFALAVMTLLPVTVWADGGGGAGAGDYTYKVTPLMSPFNLFFFVETENPDPRTFRFEDKSSKYKSRPYILNNKNSKGDTILYADVNYENEETGRVSGGYIFYGGGTDGGEVELEISNNPDAYYQTWENTGKKYTLPVLKDGCDFLIDTYANKGSFFANMDAVQSGLSQISLYSGSFVRGRLNKVNDYWKVSLSPHIDQSLYIFSPYEREDNRTLFASDVYPYLLDSWGFPGMMQSVAERLNSSATCAWSDSSHYIVNVTYNGETHSYGGAGNHEGQGISEDKISRYIDPGNGSSGITLDAIRSLLVQYSNISMQDDLPTEGRLTWKQIFNTVGNGAWARVSPGWSSPQMSYTYLYQEGEGDTFDTSEHELGTSLYYAGDLKYADDAWVDGRYVDEYQEFILGATFEDHPQSSIIQKNVTIPQIPCSHKYEKNTVTGKTEIVYYVTGDITEGTKANVVFKYQNGEWGVWSLVFNNGCANYEAIKQMAERGVIDERYLDMVQLTQSEVDALDVDKNTNSKPASGYIYDGTAAPGTPYNCNGSTRHSWDKGVVDKEPTCMAWGHKTFTCLVCGATKGETVGRLAHKWSTVSYTWAKDNSTVTAKRTCENVPSHEESETVNTTEEVIIKPSCENLGKIKYTATFTNQTFSPVSKNQFVNPLGHEWSKWEVVSAPTAETEGLKQCTCGRCGTTQSEAIPKVIDENTPTMEVANKAKTDTSIPKVSKSKIKTSGSVSKQQLKVTFPKSSAADNYLIQYRSAGTEQPSNVWTGGKGYYTIKGLKKNSLCQIRIIGFAKHEDWTWYHGEWSDVIYRYMRSVTLKKVTPGKRKLTVTWSKDSNASGYRVQYSTKKNMSGAKTVKINGKTKTKCTIKKLKKGKKYYVKVMPVKVKSSKTYTGILSGTKGARVK